MKKILLITASVALVAASLGGVAAAQDASATCPEGSTVVEKNKHNNRVLDTEGDQCYKLKAGSDTLDNPGSSGATEGDVDTVFGGGGKDLIDLRDSDGDDFADCGDGDDTLIIDAELVYGEATVSDRDEYADNCENVYETVTVSGYPAETVPPPTVAGLTESTAPETTNPA